MFVLITYDVNTEDADGKRRLRRIAKQCVNYGQRVQNSVFECILDPAQCRRLKAELCSIMDAERDSLRFYYLGNKYENKIEHFGTKSGYDPEGMHMLSLFAANTKRSEKIRVVRAITCGQNMLFFKNC